MLRALYIRPVAEKEQLTVITFVLNRSLERLLTLQWIAWRWRSENSELKKPGKTGKGNIPTNCSSQHTLKATSTTSALCCDCYSRLFRSRLNLHTYLHQRHQRGGGGYRYAQMRAAADYCVHIWVRTIQSSLISLVRVQNRLWL